MSKYAGIHYGPLTKSLMMADPKSTAILEQYQSSVGLGQEISEMINKAFPEPDYVVEILKQLDNTTSEIRRQREENTAIELILYGIIRNMLNGRTIHN